MMVKMLRVALSGGRAVYCRRAVFGLHHINLEDPTERFEISEVKSIDPIEVGASDIEDDDALRRETFRRLLEERLEESQRMAVAAAVAAADMPDIGIQRVYQRAATPTNETHFHLDRNGIRHYPVESEPDAFTDKEYARLFDGEATFVQCGECTTLFTPEVDDVVIFLSHLECPVCQNRMSVHRQHIVISPEIRTPKNSPESTTGFEEFNPDRCPDCEPDPKPEVPKGRSLLKRCSDEDGPEVE
jgi:hypothetical protein